MGAVLGVAPLRREVLLPAQERRPQRFVSLHLLQHGDARHSGYNAASGARSLVEAQRVPKGIQELDVGADLIRLDPGPQVGVVLGRELGVELAHAARSDIEGGPWRAVAVMLGKVED